MPISIYAATVPAFHQILECQSSLVHKAAAHAEANSIPHEKILRGRRDSSDQSFRRHILLGTTTGIQTTVMLSRQNVQLPRPPYESLEALARLVSVGINYLDGLKEVQFAGAEGRKYRLKAAGGEPVECTAAEVIFSHALPIFYYHTVSAHAVLMHLGVGLKNWEFYNPPG